MNKVIIINGPNLNLLGKREPGIYGDQSFEDYLQVLRDSFRKMDITYFQSNVEGELINKIQEWGFENGGIVLNAGGYSHTSVSIADAVAAVNSPVVEVHISNIFARESFRHNSLVGARCMASVSGMGLYGYKAAIDFLNQLKERD